MSNYAFAIYSGDGVTDTFAFGFPYMEDSDIVVYVNDVAVGREIISSPAQAVVLAIIPEVDDEIRIVRETEIASSVADFEVGSTVRPVDLDTLATQGLYVNQETRDIATGAADVAEQAATDAAAAVLASDAAVATANTALATANSAVITANNAVTIAGEATDAAAAATAAAGEATAAAGEATTAAGEATAAAGVALAAADAATAAAAALEEDVAGAVADAALALSTANTAIADAAQAAADAASAASDASDAQASALAAQQSASDAATDASAAVAAVSGHIGVGGVAQHPVATNTDAGFVPVLEDDTAKFLRSDGTWAAPAGSGDMNKSTYDPDGVESNAFDSANHKYTPETAGLTAVTTQAAITELDIEKVQGQTAWIDPPILSINTDTTKFDISAGVGIVADWSDMSAPVFTKVVFPGYTAVSATLISSSESSGIRVSAAGAILQSSGATPPSAYRDALYVGDIIHVNRSTINAVQNKPIVQWDNTCGLRDIALSIGIINRSGNRYSAYGADLQLSKTAGEFYRAGINFDNDPTNPNVITSASLTPVTNMLRGYRDGVGGWNYAAQTTIDPTYYDNNSGTLQAVSNNQWTIQRIYCFPGSNQTVVLYGQHVYASFAEAIVGIRDSVIVDANLTASLRGIVIVKGNCTNLSDTAYAVFYEADKFGTSASVGAGATVASHNLLTSLQGGTTDEYYHLTATEYSVLHSGTTYVTLLSTGWSGSTYTISCTVHDTDEVDFGLPSPTSDTNRDNAIAAGLWCSAVGATSVTITADTVPTSDIVVALKGVTV